MFSLSHDNKNWVCSPVKNLKMVGQEFNYWIMHGRAYLLAD
jgi:hypothetical protein